MLSSFTCCSYQKEERAKAGKLPKEQRWYVNLGALDVRVFYDLESVKVGAVKGEVGKEISGSEWVA
jgi:hypothetical protein